MFHCFLQTSAIAMPSWWGKSSSKEAKKKTNKESLIDTFHKKFKIVYAGKCDSGAGGPRRRCSDTLSEKACQSISPSTQVSRCHSFAERPHAQPLPLPGEPVAAIRRADSEKKASAKPEVDRSSTPFLFLSHPKPHRLPDGPDPEADLETATVSSDTFTDSEDQSDSRLPSPQASDHENGNRTVISSPSRSVFAYRNY